jgi:anti-sigma factor RsiW
MECRDWRERISASVDGEASPEEARRIEAHLEECAECRDLERKMRAVGVGVARAEGVVPPDFREKLFSRMEAEALLPRRRSLFVFSLRWAAVPVAAAAALALFMLTTADKGKDAVSPQGPLPRVARQAPATESREPAPPAVSPAPQSPAAPKAPTAATQTAREELTPEEREIVAFLDILEDPNALEPAEDIDEMEIFEFNGGSRG